MAKEKNHYEQLKKLKIAAGLPEADAHIVTETQRAHDDALEAAEAKAAKEPKGKKPASESAE